MLFSLLEVGSFDIANLIITIISIVVGLPGLVGAILLIIKKLNVKQFYKTFYSESGIRKKSREQYYFKHYVKHEFTLESWYSLKENISYKEFIKTVDGAKIVILTGSAGIGKSILMQKLAAHFRSKLQKDSVGQSLKDYGILFYKLNRQSNLEKILTDVEEEIKHSSIRYSLYLDGLDEISELSVRSGSEILNDLLKKLLTDISPKCNRIFITLRPEILDRGYSITQHIQEKDNILVFKIQNFNEKQIMAMFNYEKHNYNKKTPIKERKQNFKKLKTVIKNNPTSVFTYPLILTWANEILSECDIKELTHISWYEALGKVVDKELEREYGLYRDSKGAVISPTEYSKDDFIHDGKKFLSDIALNMALSNTQQITKKYILENSVVKQYNETQNETTGHTFLTRRLLRYVDWSENKDSQPYYEFIHNTIYWCVLAEALLNRDTPQNMRAEIILAQTNNKCSNPLLQYCHQGLWSIYGKNCFPYKDYLSYMRAIDKKIVDCNTKNRAIPFEIIFSCFYGFNEVVFDYSFKFDFTKIKKFVENRTLDLSNTSNITDLSFLNNFGNSCFDSLDCSNSNIEKAEIPEYIKDLKFSECTSLKEVSIPKSVTHIGEVSFIECKALTEVVIPDAVSDIGRAAFAECIALKKLTIGRGVKKIGQNAFDNCKGLTEINFNAIDCDPLGKNGHSVCYSSFQNAGQNENGITVNIGASVTKIPAGLFDHDFFDYMNPVRLNIKAINFTKDSACERICFSSFSGCNMPEKIVIPDSVKSIEVNAFGACDSIKKIHIGCGVENLHTSFCSSESLIEITVCEDNKNYRSIDGNLYSKDGKTLLLYAKGKQDTSFYIPDSVTKIANAAFADCLLHNIHIPNRVTEIGEDAFYGCTFLEEIVLPPNISKLEIGTFNGCNSLKNINIPDNVQQINLRNLGENCFSIITTPFSFCKSLTEINVSANNSHFKSIDGNLYSKDGTKLIIYASGKTENEFTIPNGVTIIENSAFSYNKNLSRVNITRGVKIIGKQAFYSCTSIEDIIIPNSVVKIEEDAFLSHEDPTGICLCSLEKIKYTGTAKEWNMIENNNGFGKGESVEIICNDGTVKIN